MALVGACVAWYVYAQEASVSRNAFIEVIPPPGMRVKWVSEDDFILVGNRRADGGTEKVTVRPRRGWKLTQPKDGVMTLTPGKMAAYAVESLQSEDGGGGYWHVCNDTKEVVTKHFYKPEISLGNVFAAVGGIIVPPKTPSVDGFIDAKVVVVSDGLHKVTTTTTPCTICYPDGEQSTEVKFVTIKPTEFEWHWSVAGKQGKKVCGKSFSTAVEVDESGRFEVSISVAAKDIPSCCDCEDDNGDDKPKVLVLQILSIADKEWPGDSARKKMGVGELGVLILEPIGETGTWQWLSPKDGPKIEEADGIRFEALYSAGTSTVEFEHIPSGLLATINYTVVEPFDHTSEIETWFYPVGIAGAGMNIQAYLPPHDVSFENVEWSEISAYATSVTGYFADNSIFPETHLLHGYPTVQVPKVPINWEPIGVYQNKKNAIADKAGVPREGLNPPWRKGWFWGALGYSGGAMTWPITAEWRVKGDAQPNPLKWTDQSFKLTGRGTVTVEKLGHKVTRELNGNYTEAY